MKRRLKCRRRVVPCALVLLFAAVASAQEQALPKIDHILLEVGDLEKSIAFYHDFLGLQIKSQSRIFAMLQSGNVGVFLSSTHWDWDQKRPTNARPGWGMYPHFEVADVAAAVAGWRKPGARGFFWVTTWPRRRGRRQAGPEPAPRKSGR